MEEKKSVNQTPRKKKNLERKFETDLEKKIKGLLALPTVKNIKARAQEYRMQTEGNDTAKILFAEANRLSILKSYEEYIHSSSKPMENKRVKTEAEALSPTLSPVRFL